MLIKNLGSNMEQWGHFTLSPGEWDYLPTQVAQDSKLHTDPGFECLSPSNNTQPDVIIFSGCPMGTTGGGQHPAQIARELKNQGCRVLYVQTGIPISDEGNELVVVREGNLFSSKSPSNQDYQKWCEILAEFSQQENKIALFTFPSKYLTEMAMMAWMNGYKTAYWCLDDWEAINKAQKNHAYDPSAESQLTRACDSALTTAKILASKIQPQAKNPVKVIPNGFSRLNFPVNASPDIPSDLHLGEKTLVYWGELQGRWLDFNLLEDLARMEPTWQINLIGPDKQVERRLQLPNVHYLGEKPVSELYAYGHHADCGLIPFKEGAVSAAVNPIKAYEYLACNLPIVTIPMPELDNFPFAFQVPGNARRFQKTIQSLPSLSDVEKQRIKGFLQSSTWEKRALTFLDTMNGVKHASNTRRSEKYA
jgi:glycosyltransferase involved in cell wall biosynthesis